MLLRGWVGTRGVRSRTVVLLLLALVAGRTGPLRLCGATDGSAMRQKARDWLASHPNDDHMSSWPIQQRLRGVSYVGPAERLRGVVRKLLEGKEPVKMVALGGSITFGIGVRSQNETYAGRLNEWLKKAFPGQEHSVHNGAVRATTSTYMALCLELHLPPGDLDVVLVEYAINDTPRPSPSMAPGSRRAALERLLRKLLRARGAPAVLMVNMLAIHRDMEQGYWNNAERDFNEFSTYYGLPTVSFKAATFHEMRSGSVEGSNITSFYGTGAVVHPAEGGHQITADLVATMMQNVVSDIASDVWSEESTPLDESSYVIPPPMITNNYEAQSSLCLMDNSFTPVVTFSEGWNWTDEGKGPGKWGYVTDQVGAKLRFKVDTRAPADRKYSGKIWLSVAYLKSYHSMGQAHITCVSGCKCDLYHLDGMTKEREVSLTYMASVAVTQHEACEIQVEVLETTTSKKGGRKVKISGVTVSSEEDVKTKEGVLNYIRDISLSGASSAPGE